MIKKIAFIGSVGTGKTTIVNKLSDFKTINTDVESSKNIGKSKTTVGMDYGHLVINGDVSLGLYGVPGQRKFSMIWDFVKEGLWAIVILIKNDDLESINEFEHLINYFEISDESLLVIGITHADSFDTQNTLKRIRIILDKYKIKPPVFTIDPRNSDSVMLIMHTLIAIEGNR